MYCTDNQKPSIFMASMAQFRDYVLRAAIPSHNDLTVAMVLNSVILEQIRMEREGDFIDTALIRSCIYMLEGLYETGEEKSTKLYLTCFEPEYLVASQAFYASEGSSILANADAGTFCRHAKKRANEEQDRCRSTLSTLTLPKIKAIVENELIRRNIREVINLEVSGVKFMLDNDRLNELEMVYDLISRVDPKKEDLQKAVQARIIELGTELNTSAINASKASSTKPPRIPPKPDSDRPDGETKAPAEKPLSIQTAAAIKWIDDVLQLKEKYDNVLAKAFQSDQGFHAAFSRSFTEFINAFERSSEYLSLFFDENLKKGIKGKTENEVDLLIDKGITLLQYIQDKDMFERYYKKHLSKRLLMKRSISTDGERQMISKMKMTVGNSFTQKIENMFNDIAMSEDLTSSYKRHVSQLGDADPKRVDLDVNVLTSTMWPLEIMTPNYEDWQTSCLFPPEIERIKHGFEKFYLDQHSGRKLMWQPSMGTADMRGYFPEMKGTKKTRELNVSTYAMVILMLYNDLPPGESLTCEEIQAKTNIPVNDLKRNLQSLAVAQKSRVLLKNPMSKDVKNEDRFFFNEKFFSQFQRVKIGVVTSGNNVEDIDERAETEKKNDATRGGTVEAAIVRIMKCVCPFVNTYVSFLRRTIQLITYHRQRKELSHQGLISEVIQQLTPRFMPDVNMVKKRIESLLEREYLERIEGAERPAYRYMA